MAGLEGTVDTLPALPPVEVNASFSDLLDNLSAGLMLVGEANWRRWVVLGDFAYLGVEAEGTLAGTTAVELDADVVEGTLLAGYALVEENHCRVDMFAGLRVWSAETDVSLSGLVTGSRSSHETWVDPILAARVRAQAWRKLYMNTYVDLGGFGAGSDFTWQVYGGLGYPITDRLSAQVGYRYLDVDYDKDGFIFDVALQGWLIGLGVSF